MSKYLPLLLLLITLLSGMWLRGMWAGLLPPSADSQFLLHAHSHIALLGWVLISFLLLFWKTFFPNVRANFKNAVLFGLFLLSLFMFHAFLNNGYALWSILSSMLFILITWIMAGFYLKKRILVEGLVRNLWDTSFFWLIVSSVGPLLLSFGQFMGHNWILFWVSFYLYLQFLGWIVPFIFLLAHHFFPIRTKLTNALFTFNLMLLPAFFTMSKGYSFTFFGLEWLMMLPLASAVFFMLKSFERGSNQFALIYWSVILSLGLGFTFLLMASLPVMKDLFGDNRMASIGFVHMILLGGFTILAMELLFENSISSKNRSNSFFQALYLIGTWTMVFSLFFSAVIPIIGLSIYFPVQSIAFWSGVMILVSIFGRIGIEITHRTDILS